MAQTYRIRLGDGIIPEHIDADIYARAECARAIAAAAAQEVR